MCKEITTKEKVIYDSTILHVLVFVHVLPFPSKGIMKTTRQNRQRQTSCVYGLAQSGVTLWS
jgi:hypothetical protein